MMSLIQLLASAETTIVETTMEEPTTVEVTNTDTLAQVGAEISENINTAVKNANQFMEALESYIPKIIAFGINLLIALVILAIGKILIRFLMKVVNNFLSRSHVEISVHKFLDSFIKAILYFVLLIVICNQMGIPTSSLVALLSTIGLTVGLALKDSFANFAGGILILVLKPFKVGDYIEDGSSGKEGTVQRIDLFYTMIVTVDNKLITIPNGSLCNTYITNASAFDTRRVDLKVGVGYDSDIEKAKAIIYEVGLHEPTRLPDQEPVVCVLDLAASEVSIALRVWVKTEDYWTATTNMKEQLKKSLDAADIEIPYSQIDVHMKQEK